MKSRRGLRLLALFAVFALILAACGDGDGAETTEAEEPATTAAEEEAPTTAAEEEETTTTAAEEMAEGEPLKLGTILPLTGDLSDFGPSMEDSVRLAVDEANAVDGVNGAPIELITADSGTQEDIARDSASTLAAEGVQAVVGAASSRISLSFIDTLVQNGIVQISPSNTSPQFTDYTDDGFYFRTAHSDALQGPLLADLIIGDGVTSVGIIALADSYGQGLADAFVNAYEAQGGEITVRQDYDPNGTNFDAEVTNVTSADPEAVICICFPETGSIIYRAAFEQGLLEKPWYTVDGLQSSDFPETAFPDDVELLAGDKGTGPGSVDTEAADHYATLYDETYGADPGPFAQNAYDAAWVIILAAEASDGTGRGIADALPEVTGPPGTQCFGTDCLELLRNGEDIDYEGVIGPIDFDPNGDLGVAFFEIWQFNEEGDVEEIETGIQVESPAGG